MADTEATVIDFYRGTTTAVSFRFRDWEGNLIALDNSEYTMTVRVTDEVDPVIEKDTAAVDSNFVKEIAATLPLPGGDTETGDRLVWTPTIAESRRIPLGNLSVVEIERRGDVPDEDQEFYGSFRLRGLGGVTGD